MGVSDRVAWWSAKDQQPVAVLGHQDVILDTCDIACPNMLVPGSNDFGARKTEKIQPLVITGFIDKDSLTVEV